MYLLYTRQSFSSTSSRRSLHHLVLSDGTGSQLRRCLNAHALRFLQQKFVIGTVHKVAIFLCPMFKKLSVFPEGMRPDVLSTVRQFIADFPDPVSYADSQPMQDTNFRPEDKRGASDRVIISANLYGRFASGM